jgi:ribosomal protein S18 acetylase RimI-like enzyme
MVLYTDSMEGITADHLEGFFAGWKNPPTPKVHLRLLRGSQAVVLAVDETDERVVGYITAVGDGVLSAYIPLLEVLPEYRKQGIGSQLVRRMLDKLKNLYMIDLMCDQNLQSFYLRFGMKRGFGMMIRNYHRQSGT